VIFGEPYDQISGSSDPKLDARGLALAANLDGLAFPGSAGRNTASDVQASKGPSHCAQSKRQVQVDGRLVIDVEDAHADVRC
jgi:hypothetical protein